MNQRVAKANLRLGVVKAETTYKQAGGYDVRGMHHFIACLVNQITSGVE